MKIAAPRDAKRVAELLNEAVEVSDGPTVVRFPKGQVGGEVEAIANARRHGRAELAGRGPGHGRPARRRGR